MSRKNERYEAEAVAYAKAPNGKSPQNGKQTQRKEVKPKSKAKSVCFFIGLGLLAAALVLFVVGVLYCFVPSFVASKPDTLTLDLFKTLFLAAAGSSFVGMIFACIGAANHPKISKFFLFLGVLIMLFSLGFAVVTLAFSALIPNMSSFA